MKTAAPNTLNAQIYSEASQWLVEFRSGDIEPQGRKAFIRWLRTSPEHVRAYLELAAIWNEGARLDAQRKFDDDILVQAALSEENLVVLRSAASPPVAEEGSTNRRGDPEEHANPERPHSFKGRWPTSRRRLFTLAAALAVAAVGLSTWYSYQRGLYSTAIGEQRSVTLPDGSNIQLDARSRMRVTYDETERHVDLLEGRAYFRVAKDATRPFIVGANNAQVRAVGTQFDIYKKRIGTLVTVVEGRVAVVARPRTAEATAKSEPAMASAFLDAGEQVLVTARATDRPRSADIAAVTAWTQKRLVFQAAPLIDVADEFNRYNRRRLVIQSPELYDFHVTGIFSSTEPDSLLRFLATRPGIVITEGKDDVVVAHRP